MDEFEHDWDEEPEEPFTDGPLKGKTVSVNHKGWKGIAFYCIADDDDGRCVVVMVGDDRKHEVDSDDCTEISELDFCGVCGQMGCAHDGKDRE